MDHFNTAGCYQPRPFTQYKRAFYRENGLQNGAVNCLLPHGGALYAGTAAGLYRFEGGAFQRLAFLKETVRQGADLDRQWHLSDDAMQRGKISYAAYEKICRGNALDLLEK